VTSVSQQMRETVFFDPWLDSVSVQNGLARLVKIIMESMEWKARLHGRFHHLACRKIMLLIAKSLIVDDHECDRTLRP
jgi:hypothetical protein